MQVVAGIDPGLEGAVALLILEEGQAERITLYGMPTRRLRPGRRAYDLTALGQLARQLGAAPAALVALEDVTAWPGMGRVSAYRLGLGVGLWQGLLSAVQVPWERVRPQQWRRTVVDGAATKREVQLRAAARWPAVADQVRRSSGMADALWLAEYARQKVGVGHVAACGHVCQRLEAACGRCEGVVVPCGVCRGWPTLVGTGG